MLALLFAVTAAVHVELVPADLRCDGTVRAELADGTATGEAPVHDAAAVLTPGTGATRVVLHSQQCWAPVVTIDPATPSSALRIDVWPAAQLRGELAVPSGTAMPHDLQVRFESPPGSTHPVPRTETRCEVRDRKWTCTVPRAPLDIRLASDGFAPHYFWELTPADPVGVVRLERGASISGWVVDPSKAARTLPIEVTLAPVAYPNGPKPPDRRQTLRTQTVRASARGFFQFRGVTVGEPYTITARRAGRAAAYARDVSVDRPAEHALPRALELGDLGAIEFTVTPATSPAGEPWRVGVQRRLDSTGILVDVRGLKTVAGNRWRVDDLEPGEYRIGVQDAQGATYHRAYVEVTDGVSELAFHVSAVPVQGRVHMGDDPLEATLKFENDGRRLSLHADSDGQFAGSLPSEGEWTVQVEPATARMRTRGRKVDVARDAESGVAKIDIALPRTYVSGTVTDESGLPVADVNVEVYRKGRYETNGSTDAKGAFDLLGIEPGQVTLHAVAEDAESLSVPVTVSEDDGAEVTLQVVRRPIVRGTITRRDGRGVAGALIRYMGPTGKIFEETTGPSGEFALRVASEMRSVDVVVLAPGHPLKLDTLPVQRQPVAIVLDGRRGLLHICSSGSGPWPSLRRNGRLFLLPLLLAPHFAGPPREWEEGGYAIEVEPDTYAVCFPGSGCETVTVPPGGTVESGTKKETRAG